MFQCTIPSVKKKHTLADRKTEGSKLSRQLRVLIVETQTFERIFLGSPYVLQDGTKIGPRTRVT